MVFSRRALQHIAHAASPLSRMRTTPAQPPVLARRAASSCARDPERENPDRPALATAQPRRGRWNPSPHASRMRNLRKPLALASQQAEN